MKAALIVSHGRRQTKAKKETESLIANIRKISNIPVIRRAFLEIESPNIPDGIKECVEQGAAEIILLLNFFNSGRHVDIDIPKIVEAESKKYPLVKIKISNPVGQHPSTSQLFLDLFHKT